MNYEIHKLEKQKQKYYDKILNIDLKIKELLIKEKKKDLIDLTDFKKIQGYSNYLIDTKGNIYSLKNNKLLKNVKSNSGYYLVCLWGNGKKRNHLVHRLVAETFIPNPNNYKEVNHKDFNKLNNNIKNLEWCSHNYNLKYSNLERFESKPVLQIHNNKIIKEYKSITEASKSGFDISNISKCCKNKQKKHKGFIWKYK